MKMRTKAMWSMLVILSLISLIEVYFGWQTPHDCFVTLLEAWLVVPLWELYVSRGVGND